MFLRAIVFLIAALFASTGSAQSIKAPFKVASSNPIIGLPTMTLCTSGRAACQAFFDAKAITDAAFTSNPSAELRFVWDFGESTLGNWTYGLQASKNASEGVVAAHLYETAGTYFPKLTVTNGTDSAVFTFIAVVGAFTDAQTVCVGLTAALGVDGCPSAPATVLLSNDLDDIITNNVVSDKQYLFHRGETFTGNTAGKLTASRCALGAYGTDPNAPVFTSSATYSPLIQVSTQATASNDCRISDIEINGQSRLPNTYMISGGSTASQLSIIRVNCHHAARCQSFAATTLDDQNSTASVSVSGTANIGDTKIHVTALQSAAIGNAISVNEAGGNVIFTGTVVSLNPLGCVVPCIELSGALPSQSVGGAVLTWVPFTLLTDPPYPLYSGIMCFECVFHDDVGGGGSLTIFSESSNYAVIGSRLYNATAGEHTARNPAIIRGVYQSNTIEEGATNKLSLTIRAPDWGGTPTYPPHTYTEYVVLRDNRFPGGSHAIQTTAFQPKNTSSDQRHRYTLVERNLYTFGSSTTTGMLYNSANLDTFRNNICDFTSGANPHACVDVDGTATAGLAPLSNTSFVYNNTAYSGGVGTTLRIFRFQTGSLNMTAQNNLCSAFGYTSGSTRNCIDNSSTGSACPSLPCVSNNSTNGGAGQAVTVNPTALFSVSPPVTLSDYRVLLGSYAKAAGTNPHAKGVYVDINGVSRPTGAADTYGAACNAAGC